MEEVQRDPFEILRGENVLELEYEVTGPTFKYIESLWFRYPDMISKMRDIEMDVVNYADDNADIKGKGATSNPTESVYFNRERRREGKQYKTLENNVKVIEDVLNSLPDDYKKVARSRYFTKYSKKWDEIAMETGYSERHARRIRDMIVVATAEKLGLW